jgi:drug/metabolite transporter (DMT)-like permease
MDEAGAPGFYLHGAKLVLVDGASAKVAPDAVKAALAAIRDDVHQVQVHALSVTQATEYGCCYRPDELAALMAIKAERRLSAHMDGARFANAVAFLGGTPAQACAGVDALSFGCVKNGGMNAEAIVFFDPALADLARYRRKRAGHLQSKGRYLAAQVLAMLEGDLWLDNARAGQCRGQRDRQRRRSAPAASGRGERSVSFVHRGRTRGAAAARLRVLRLGPRCGPVRRRLGHQGQGCAGAGSRHREPVTETAPPHALLRPRVAVPFLTISLIWGSTWFVITGQIDGVPAAWSVAWRFVLATVGMFALAFATGNRAAMPRKAHLLALAIGLTQFCGNYNLVYQAELHLTSGIVAVMVGLMIVPNAVLGRALLGQPITARFLLGSTIAIGGIALLLINEGREAPLGGNVALGIWLALGAMISASISNVIQARETGRQVPLFTLIAWSMLYGTLIDVAVAAATSGPPVLPTDRQYWLGTATLPSPARW